MAHELAWGIPPVTGGIDDAKIVQGMNEEERKAILARRKHYDLAESKTHAIGLALSGGGIRSATFSLGCWSHWRGPRFANAVRLSLDRFGWRLSRLVSQARSSVRPPDPVIQRTSALVRISFHSAGREAKRPRSATCGITANISRRARFGGRLKMAAAQLYGMFLNSLGIAWVALLFVLVEQFLRQWPRARWVVEAGDDVVHDRVGVGRHRRAVDVALPRPTAAACRCARHFTRTRAPSVAGLARARLFSRLVSQFYRLLRSRALGTTMRHSLA